MVRGGGGGDVAHLYPIFADPPPSSGGGGRPRSLLEKEGWSLKRAAGSLCSAKADSF